MKKPVLGLFMQGKELVWMQVLAAAGRLPLWGILVAALVVVAGYGIVYSVVSHKWGYTPEREKELEDAVQRPSGEHEQTDRPS